MSAREHWHVLAVPVAGTLIGFIGIYTVPYLVGVAVDAFGWSAEQAGWLAFAAMASTAAGSALSSRCASGHRRLVTLLATVVAACCQGLCATGLPVGAFIALQVVASLAAGLVTGITTASVAGSPQADQHYGRTFAITSLLFGALLYLVPEAQERWGTRSLFGVIAVVQCVSLPGLLAGRPYARVLVSSVAHARPMRRLVMLLMAAMTLGFAAYGGVYSVCERIAVQLGIGPTAIGAALGLSTAAAVIGAAMAGRWGTRAGRTLPLCGSLLALGLADLAILAAHQPAAWAAGMLLYGLVSMVFTTYAYATAAALDPSGRLVALVQGFVLLPYALGPVLIGACVSGSPPQYATVGWVTLAINVAAALLVAPVVLALDRSFNTRPTHQADAV